MHPFSNIAFRGNLHRAAHLRSDTHRRCGSQNVVVYAQVMCYTHYPKRSAHLINTTSGGNDRPFHGWPYNSIVSRFIKRLILDGKKGAATKIFDASLELLKKNIEQYLEDEGKTSVSWSAHKRTTLTLTEKNNLYLLANLTKEEIFVTALRKAQPWITTTSLRRGGKKVIIPEILTPSQQESIAIRWLILNARLTTGSSGKAIAECLALEFFGCLTNQGKTIQQREQLHKLAEANRAWAN